MIKISLTNSFIKDIKKKFSYQEGLKIFDLIQSLEKSPNKGKIVAKVGEILVKELKYKSFRFYFLISERELKLLLKNEIYDLLIKFIKMSKKNNQQKVIEEIKILLKKLDFEGFK